MATKKTDAPAEETLDAEKTKAEEPKQETTAGEDDQMKQMLQDMMKTMQQMQSQMQSQQELIKQLQAGPQPQTRPKAQCELDSERIQKIAQEAAEKGQDAWEIEVEVFVPHRDKGEDKWYWLSINDRTAQIPADDRVQKMKLPFALILTDALKAKQREEDFIDNIKVYDPKDNPHEGRW